MSDVKKTPTDVKSRVIKKIKYAFGNAALVFAIVIDIVRYFFKKTARKATGISLAALVLAVSLTAATVCYAMEYNAAVTVVVNGTRVGYVTDADNALLVEQGIYSSVHGDIEGIIDLQFEDALVFGAVSEPQAIIEAVLKNAEGLESVCGLFVDGMLTAYAEYSAEIEQNLSILANTYTAEGATFKGYANSVEIKETYLTADGKVGLVTTLEGFLEGRTGVQIVTSRVESYDEELPYYTHVIYDESRVSSYNKVIKKGENGLSYVTADIIYINGERARADVITRQLISLPVSAKVKKGMCEEAIEAIRESYAYSADENDVELMTFPCQITKRTYISSYWGDRRNHKGVDIASPKGSEIYAAADGVVSFVGWNGAYGKCVIIDHPDGKTQTLYAHNSSNLVKKGDTVTAGQVIAKVGSTGKSTGNHLHFSVLVKGKHVNPEKYLGLNDK